MRAHLHSYNSCPPAIVQVGKAEQGQRWVTLDTMASGFISRSVNGLSKNQ